MSSIVILLVHMNPISIVLSPPLNVCNSMENLTSNTITTNIDGLAPPNCGPNLGMVSLITIITQHVNLF
jgi:hypothetical protein